VETVGDGNIISEGMIGDGDIFCDYGWGWGQISISLQLSIGAVHHHHHIKFVMCHM